MKAPRRRTRWLASLLLLGSLSGLAQAESLEQKFRGFLDHMRSSGERLMAPATGALAEARKPELRDRVDKLPLGTVNGYAIFVRPGCRGCDAALRHMRSRGITFEVLDVTRSTTARDAYGLVQSRGLPTVLMDSQVLMGWDEKLFQQSITNEANKATMQGPV